MPDALLKLSSARTGYGPNDVLRDVSLEVRPGEIVTLLGGNGAGKTTTLGVLSGIVPLRKGAVVWNGQDVSRLGPAERLKAGLVLCPEGRRIFPRLTVEGAEVRLAWQEEAFAGAGYQVFGVVIR